MVFSSYIFILIFLPIAWLGFELTRRSLSARTAFGWLVLASLVYFGYWNPIYLPLLGFSILFNFYVGQGVGSERIRNRKALLVFGLVVNIGLFCYFKYANFFSDQIDALTGFQFVTWKVILPIGISFFTFQQIAFLVDSYRGEAREYGLIEYALFVTFFPQLIAGPIVHHKEMVPQFLKPPKDRDPLEDLAIGITIFTAGLGKKVILADLFAQWANPVFAAADAGIPTTGAESWIGMVCFILQLYFDFSGYSDMAMGIARMFGVRLPLNFFSPHKSRDVIELWRRWHITLGRFLRDYVYIPLGGSRCSTPRMLFNLWFTMFIAGLWHGPAWTFVVFGLSQGLFLSINHVWASMKKKHPLLAGGEGRTRIAISVILTFISWIYSITVFRAGNFTGVWTLYKGSVGANGDVRGTSMDLLEPLPWMGLAFLIIFFAPNVMQIMSRTKPAYEYAYSTDNWLLKERSLIHFTWKPNLFWAVITAAVFFASLLLIGRGGEFIYFQF
ncbi:MAG: hypothetical protein MK089_03910 [Phycisphaerales bacterium]|nr:hypothetical protein [Phycisphaerales bacterium]